VGRRPIPPIAWLLSAGTAFALAVMTYPTLRIEGINSYFHEGDASFFRATALDPLGTGQAFVKAGFASEVPYRYGRIGLPLLGWVAALGRPGLVPWSLVVIHLAAIAAVPGLAAVLADEYKAPPVAGAIVLLSPVLFIREIVYAEPLLISLVLLAYILESRNSPRSALVVFAAAILVKEIAVLALIPWVWRAAKRHDLGKALAYAGTVLPYAAWCVWLRVRVGEFPFLAHTVSRTQALTWPGVGMHRVFSERTPHHVAVISIVLVTFVLCVVGAFVARRFPIGMFTGALAVLTVCLGENALRFPEETLRLLVVPQVFALLSIVIAMTAGRFSTWGGLAFQSSRDASRSIRDRGSPRAGDHSYTLRFDVFARCRRAFDRTAAYEAITG